MTENERSVLRRFSVLVAVTTLVALTTVGAVGAQESVTGCETIDSPGDYVLQDDITEDADLCIEITSSDVSFDGQGNTITGVGDENATAIAAQGALNAPLTNIEITNVDINDWGEGVRFSLVNESEITDVEVTRANSTAVTLTESSHNLVANSTLNENEEGINLGSFLLSAFDNTVEDNTVENTNGSAVTLAFNAQENTVRRNTIRNNKGGIVNLLFPSNNTFTGNSVTDNRLGVLSAIAAENGYTNNDVTDNDAGFAGVFSFGETVENNRINNNQEAGIVLLNSLGTDIVGNEVKQNKRGFTDVFVPNADEEAQDEFSFDDSAIDEILDGQEENVVERMVVGSSGAETVLSFESNNVTVSGVDSASVPSAPSGTEETGLYFEAKDELDVNNFEGDLGDIDEDIDEGELEKVEDLDNAYLDVTVHYDGAGVSDANETNLTLRRYDDTGGWTEVSSTVDTQEDEVSANLTEFSTFGVFLEDDGNGDDGDGGDVGEPNGNPFFGTNDGALGRQAVISSVVQWNLNGEIDGTPYTRQEIIGFIVEWNLAN